MKLVPMLFFVFAAMSVAGQQNSAHQLAQKMAQKMKDSLSLTDAQKNQLYNINMQLHNQKMNIRQQYKAGDSLGYYLQRVENTRDSLYHQVLSGEKYLLYRQKKTRLINNN